MRAGTLRHRVLIQKRDPSQSPSGAVSDGWVSVATTYAAIEPLTGRERLTADQVQAETTHRIIIRWRPGFDPTYRIRFGDRIFHVESAISREERGRSLELLAREEVPA